MKSALLGIAAASIAMFSLSATPASAQDFTGAFPTVPRFQGWGVRSRPGFGFDGRHHDGHHDGDHRRNRHEGFGDSVFVSDYGAWAYYNNRSWDEDSYNDWWHDNPDRAYPAWVRRNQQHCDRMWWSGDTLVC